MSYTVLARKYRPQTFEELVGQEHVATTLANAIKSDRVAHAFLLTGVRGVGKTTTARLLAKALNCEQGPTPTPCNECDICKDVTGGVDIDVQEIDGASNNSVDDVRRLQESLPFRPARDRFKIVIVDEVHMLSSGAFNAFLKTLEEPPPHVKFIFATTEAQKVPVTIRSRCQRYDFRLIPQAAIADRVRSILAAEQVECDDDTVGLVAREAAGSMRDALTLLDQLIAFSGQTLVGEEVARHLGIASRTAIESTATAILDGDGRAVLQKVAEVSDRGADPMHFIRQLLQLLRDLVVLKVAESDESLVDLASEELEQARSLARAQDVLELQRVFAAVAKLVDDVAKASSPRLVVEMGLVRIATRPKLSAVAELLQRVERLEKGAGGSSSGGSSPGRGPGRSRSSAPTTSRAQAAPRSAPPPEARSSEPPPEPPPQRSPRPPQASRATPQPSRKAPPPDRTPAASQPDPGSAAPPSSPEGRLRRAALQEWEKIVGDLREGRPALAAVLEHGVPQLVSRERIILSFQDGSFYGRQAASAQAKEAILEAAQKHLGAKPAIEIRFDAQGAGSSRTVAAVEATRRDAKQKQRRREALNHPAVLDAMQVFPESRGHVEVHLEGE